METDQYLKIAGNIHLSYYVEAAHQLGIDYQIIIRSLMARFSTGNKHWYIINTVTPINNVPSTTISKNKNYTYMVLRNAGIPLAEQVELFTQDDAINFYQTRKDIVLKPVRNLGGNGVTILPQNEQEVIEAFNLALDKNLSETKVGVLGEKFQRGINYRVLVLDDKVIGVVRREPASVTGNGIQTVNELIYEANRVRKERVLKPIKMDQILVNKLAAEGVGMDDILPSGQKLYLRYNANLTTGGTTTECSSELHPYYQELCIKATRELGLKLGGVDLIAPDITQPGECVINEINYNPGLRLHYKVDQGESVKVAVPIMEYIRDNYS